MTAKEFVLEKMPEARAEKFFEFALMRKVTVWYIYDHNERVFAGGRTETKAWKDAKSKLQNK
jgi:hypothetical protein